MELSSKPLILASDRGAIRMVDLRAMGAPVAVYAAPIRNLYVDGNLVDLDRPAYAVIDTGTTGVTCSDTIFEFGRVPDRWRDCKIDLTRDDGALCSLEASVRRRRGKSAYPHDTVEFDEFPLIVSRTHVPWFDVGFGKSNCDVVDDTVECSPGKVQSPLSEVDSTAPHIIFVGLACLWTKKVTIDVDTFRLKIA